MKFTKMHGCGNDYIYIDCTEEFVENEEKAAIILSDRHFGIGGDGIILIKKGTKADFEMVMYNADGSRGAMCGNGIRCVAKYCYDHKLTDKTTFTIESMGAVKYIDVNVENGEVKSAKVDMGKPSLKASDIPVDVFPDRVNAEFAKIIDRNNIEMRVYERGSGETLACGTGSCATAVAAISLGLCDNDVTVHLLGGDLDISWSGDVNDSVFMTGPAKEVFTGEVDLNKFD